MTPELISSEIVGCVLPWVHRALRFLEPILHSIEMPSRKDISHSLCNESNQPMFLFVCLFVGRLVYLSVCLRVIASLFVFVSFFFLFSFLKLLHFSVGQHFFSIKSVLLVR